MRTRCLAGIDAQPGGEGAVFFGVVGSEDSGDVGRFRIGDALFYLARNYRAEEAEGGSRKGNGVACVNLGEREGGAYGVVF